MGLRHIISPQQNLSLLLTWVHNFLFPSPSLVYLRNLVSSSAFPEQQTFFLTSGGQKMCKPREVTESMDFVVVVWKSSFWSTLQYLGEKGPFSGWRLFPLCLCEHQNSTWVTPSDNPCRRTYHCCDLVVSSNWVTDSLWLQCDPFSMLNNLCYLRIAL